MTTLREAAQQALEALEKLVVGSEYEEAVEAERAIYALRAALAEPPVDDPHRDHWVAIAEAAQKIAASTECGLAEAKALCAALDRLTDAALAEPVAFDHGIGADRFKVVRGAFWWHVLIGDSPTEHGKFRSRASAEKMAADLLREFRNGAFVQHEAALAEQRLTDMEQKMERSIESLKAALAEPVQEPVAWMVYTEGGTSAYVTDNPNDLVGAYRALPLYPAPPQRKPLSEEEIQRIDDSTHFHESPDWSLRFARAVERAHGIT